jgi:DNA-binding transcriptional MocR family regulator
MSNDSASVALAEELTRVVSGMTVGERLPGTRAIQREHAVSPLTVQHALEILRSRGVVDVVPGRGSFVAAPRTSESVPEIDLSWQTTALGSALPGYQAITQISQAPPAGALNLRNAYLDSALQPLGLLAAATSRAARRATSWTWAGNGGLPDLRAYLAAEHEHLAHPDDVVIVSGGQSGMAIVLGALGRRGQRVLVESPTFPGVVAAASNAGLEVVPVPTDDAGVLPDALAAAFARTGAVAFYCQPRLANPTGMSLAEDRRHAVLDIAARYGAFVIEDDYLRDLDPTDAPTLFSGSLAGHVIYLRSLTKVISPGVRIAAIVSRGPVAQRIAAVATATQLAVSPLLQQVALDVLSSAGWKRHVVGLRREIADRRAAVWSAVADELPNVPQPFASAAAPFAWIALPEGIDEAEVVRATLARGYYVYAGSLFFPAESTGPFVRVVVTTATPGVLQAGVAALGAAVTEVASRALRVG